MYFYVKGIRLKHLYSVDMNCVLQLVCAVSKIRVFSDVGPCWRVVQLSFVEKQCITLEVITLIRRDKINLCNVMMHNVYVGERSVESGSLHKYWYGIREKYSSQE